MWQSDQLLLDAWRRLITDPDSAGDFARLVLPALESDLSRLFPRLNEPDVTTAVHDAILAFLRRPAVYDPNLAALPSYLRMIARRRLVNLMAKERRHQEGRIPWEAVELDLPDRNQPEETVSFADLPGLTDAIGALSHADRLVFDLMLDGERDTTVFAVALGLADLTSDEQFDEVKRAKDRVKARLKRAGGNS